MIERIVYVSRAAPGVDARDAYDIVRRAHNRNSRFGLTGALIFLDGHFLQVLEGDADALRARFGVIATDPRHVDLSIRQSASIREATFPDEWVALREGSVGLKPVLRAFDYEPGYPPERFDGDRLVAFALACYRTQTRDLLPAD